MANSFTEGLSAGQAVIAPFVAAQQNAQAAQLAQANEAARRMFQAQQNQQALDAREALVNQELDARMQSELARNMFQVERDQARNSRQDDLLSQERQNNTALAASLFGKLNETSSQIQNALRLTEADHEQALAKAMQLSGIKIKRSRGEDFSAYLSKISQNNPEILGEYQVALQELQSIKQSSPEVLDLQTKGSALNNIFQRVVQSGNVDPSFLQQPNQSQNTPDPNDLSAFADSLEALQSNSAAPEPVTSIPASQGAVQSVGGLFLNRIPQAVNRGMNSASDFAGNALDSLGEFLSGAPEVTGKDITDTKDFAVKKGILNEEEFNALDPKAIRDLNRRRIQSNAVKKGRNPILIPGVNTID